MVSVADQLRRHVLPLRGRTDGAGMPVVDGGHGVIEMGQVDSARVKHGGSLLIGGVGVRHGDGTPRRRTAGKVRRALQLRRDVHDTQQPLRCVVQPRKGGVVRQAEIGGVLCALPLLGEKRPLHVDACQPGAALRRGAVQPYRRVERRLQHVVGQCHGRGCKGCDAVSGEVGGHLHKAVVIAVGEVRAGVAVGVDIHQTGDDIRAVQVDGRLIRRLPQYAGEAPVLHGEAAGDKAPVHENMAICKSHLTPPAGWLPPWTAPPGGIAHPAT